jgi:formylglycine-generating enzyme required for sulfatase activity
VTTLDHDLVPLPGGTFAMGSDEFYPDEKPVHERQVSPFRIGRCTVTDAQYAAVRAACRIALAANPGIRTLATHRSISPQSRPSCPGPRWWGGRMQQLAAELGLEVLL